MKEKDACETKSLQVYSILRFFSGFFSSGGGGGSSAADFSSVAFCSVSISLVISSIGLGGGVVAIVQPIHAPMPMMATKAMNTGIATSQKLRPQLSGDPPK